MNWLNQINRKITKKKDLDEVLKNSRERKLKIVFKTGKKLANIIQL